jgi:hypothetical protein
MKVAALLLLLTLPLAAADPSAGPSALVLPEAPKKHVVDKKFVGFAAFQVAANVFDVESTIGMQKKGLCKEGWSSWAVGEHPTRPKLYASAALANAGTATLAYFLKKKGKSYWWLPQVTAGGVHTFAASRNRFWLGCY